MFQICSCTVVVDVVDFGIPASTIASSHSLLNSVSHTDVQIYGSDTARSTAAGEAALDPSLGTGADLFPISMEVS